MVYEHGASRCDLQHRARSLRLLTSVYLERLAVEICKDVQISNPKRIMNITRKCAHCGKEFTLQSGSQKYCCEQCADTAKQMQEQASMLSNECSDIRTLRPLRFMLTWAMMPSDRALIVSHWSIRWCQRSKLSALLSLQEQSNKSQREGLKWTLPFRYQKSTPNLMHHLEFHWKQSDTLELDSG